MIIVLSGKPGSGKSTVGRLLAKKLGYKFYSMGDFRGKLALERGLTVDQLNAIGEKEFWTDKLADDYQKRLGESENNFVMDSWLGFYFIPRGVKIFLDVNPDVAAKRVFMDQREDEEKQKSVEDVKEMLSKRVIQTQKRYYKYYGIKNIYDKKHYDAVIDTTKLSPEQVIEKILSFLRKNKKI
ncbi:MAG: cytidylate kinase family protein [Candidatus Woesearchaeota archaeon]